MSRATNQPEIACQAMQDNSTVEVSSVHGSRPNTPPLVQKSPKRMLGSNSLRSNAAAPDEGRSARRNPMVESSFNVLARPYRDSHKSRHTSSDFEPTLLARLPNLLSERGKGGPNWTEVMCVLRSRNIRNLEPSDSRYAVQPSDASRPYDFSVHVQTGIEHAYSLSQSRRRPFKATNTAEKRYWSASSVDFVTSRLRTGPSLGALSRLITAGWVLTPDASISDPALLKRIEHASSYCKDAGIPLFVLTGVEQ